MSENLSNRTDPIKLSDEILHRIMLVWVENDDPFFCSLNEADQYLVDEALDIYKVKESDYKYIQKISGKLNREEELTEIEFQFLIKALFSKMVSARDQDLYDVYHVVLNNILYTALGEKFTLEKILNKKYFTIK